ncbi:MAG: Holliday junction branch migration protein RuvA, partial [Micrococcaceae bacterium]|nr:Holliday junction branch migration protein RuvA [Micrococcaceae bacterium]
MISSLNGVVSHVALNSAVIEVSGFGMLVQATPQTLSGLHVGREAVVHTSMVVRADSMTLFGFAAPGEREGFEVLR